MTRIPGHNRAARLLTVAAIGLIALTCGGCAMIRYVDVDSNPTGAVIYVNGERRGTTRDEKVRIQFTTPEQRALIQVLKPRYKPVFQYWTFDEVPGKKIFKLELD